MENAFFENTFFKNKNSRNRFNRSLETALEKISELEDLAEEIMWNKVSRQRDGEYERLKAYNIE